MNESTAFRLHCREALRIDECWRPVFTEFVRVRAGDRCFVLVGARDLAFEDLVRLASAGTYACRVKPRRLAPPRDGCVELRVVEREDLSWFHPVLTKLTVVELYERGFGVLNPLADQRVYPQFAAERVLKVEGHVLGLTELHECMHTSE